MNPNKIRAAVALALVCGAISQVVVAEEAAVVAAPAADSATDVAVPSLGTVQAPASMFGGDSSTNTAQRSASAGYELSGAGIGSAGIPEQNGMLTSPVKGRAVRFSNGVFVYPAVTAALGVNDNVTGAATNKISSTVYVLRPEVVAELKRRGDRYTLSYSGNYGKYSNSSADDFDHHDFWMAGDNFFTTRARMGWGVGYMMRSDPRASLTRVASAEPDRWEAPIARAVGIYGAPGAIGRFELEGSWMQKRYKNNRAFTETLDVDLSTVSGRFYYRFMPKTSALVEVRNTWADYTLSTSTQDNTDLRLYAGVEWDATAKTTGSLRVGRAYKNFENNATFKDGSGASWEGAISWSPLSYSQFQLQTSRSLGDTSAGLGNYIRNTGHNLVWNHKWATYITSQATLGYVKAAYNGINRVDDTTNYGIGFYRELGYNFRLGLNWNHTKRDSNDNLFDFSRNVTMLSLESIL